MLNKLRSGISIQEGASHHGAHRNNPVPSRYAMAPNLNEQNKYSIQDSVNFETATTESDPNVVLAAMSMLETPHSEDNTQRAIAIVENIQTSCAADYQYQCGGYSITSPSDAPNIIIAFFHSVMSLPAMDTLIGSPTDAAVPETAVTRALTAEDDMDDNGGYYADDTTGNGDDGDDALADDDVNVVAIGAVRVICDRSQYINNAPHPSVTVRIQSYGESDSEGEREGKHGRRGGKRGAEEHLRAIERAYEEPNNDFYANGALGFGSAGDQCMYTNMASLSPGCQDAIAQAQEFRHEYWAEEQQLNHAHGGCFGGLVLLILLVAFVFRCSPRFRKVRAIHKQNDEVMEVIHANPSLKAAVEAAYGKELPPLRSSLGEGCCSSPRRFCCVMLKLVTGFFLVNMIFHVAVGVTGGLMSHLVIKDEQGNEHPPPAPLILLVLFLAIAVQVLAVVGVVRGVRYVYRRFVSGTGAGAGGDDSSGNSGNSSLLTSVAAGVAGLRALVLQQMVAPAYSHPTTAVTGNRAYPQSYVMPAGGLTTGNNGYAPLPTYDNSAEMTTFSSSLAHHQAQAPMATAPTVIYTGVPVQHAPQHSAQYSYNRMV